MIRLKSRSHQIPNGFKFKLVEAKWEAIPWSSFDTIVDAATNVARANPYLAKKNNWPTTREGWVDKIDLYNAKLCESHGWTNFIVDDGGGGLSSPKLQALSQSARHVAAGLLSVKEMWGAEGPTNREQANVRAKVCCEGAPGGQRCPFNDTGDWTRFFTVPASNFIRTGLGILKDLNLTTDYDPALNVCTACDCPLKLKVFTRIEHIKAHMPADVLPKLPEWCWIKLELAAKP